RIAIPTVPPYTTLFRSRGASEPDVGGGSPPPAPASARARPACGVQLVGTKPRHPALRGGNRLPCVRTGTADREGRGRAGGVDFRSEEHTSELQSRQHPV